MARKINAGKNVGRGDIYKVDPQEVIVDPNMRARWETPGKRRVEELAHSMYENGQFNPVVCRMSAADKRIILEQGGTRLEAALWITENLDPNWRIEVKIVDHNEEEGFASAILENKDRNETSPMDDASNMRTMRERYGWSDKDIQRLLSCNSSYLRSLEVLLTLPKKVQSLVHRRKLAVSAAVLLAGLSGAELDEALSKAKASGKIDSEQVHNVARRNGKTVRRSLKHVRKVFSSMDAPPPPVQTFAERLEEFLSGEADEETFRDYLISVLS